MQSKKHSMLEICTSVFVGYWIALLTQELLMHWYGITATHSENAQIVLVFTFVSIIRGYIFRRIFNRICK